MTLLAGTAIAVGVGLTIVWVVDFVSLLLAADETDRNLRRAIDGDLERLSRPGQRTPVSIVIIARENCSAIIACVEAAIHQRDTEVDVIVVDDGSTASTFDRLAAAFDLREHDVPVRRVYPTRGIGTMYESVVSPNLRVVTKPLGGRADAINCGLNLAHHRYICVARANMVLAPSAIADSMRFALIDPAHTVGIVMPMVSGTAESAAAERSDGGLLSDARRLHQLSGFVLETVAASRLNAVLCHGGNLTIWRSDVLERLAGFSGKFIDPIAEFSFRLQLHLRERHAPFHVVGMPLSQGTLITRSGWKALVRERSDRYRSLLELIRHYHGVILRRRFGAIGLFALPQLVSKDLVTPLLVALSAVTAVIALARGAVSLLDVAGALAAIAFAFGFLTTAALLIHDRAQRALPFADLVRLTLLAPLQPFTIGPALARARIAAAWQTLINEPRYLRTTPGVRGDSSGS